MIDWSVDTAFFAAVGKLALTWSQLEFGLDCMVIIIHRWMDGEKFEKEVPRALGRKIIYLRRAFRRLGIEGDLLERYDAFLADVEKESETRHDIIHGAAIQHAPDGSSAKIVRLIHQKTHWDQREVTVTISSIDEATGRAAKLAARAQNWAQTMADLHDQDEASSSQEP